MNSEIGHAWKCNELSADPGTNASTAGYHMWLKVHGERLSMTKADLAKAIIDTAGLSPNQAREAVQLVIDLMADTLARGEHVKISGFGTFQLRDKADRLGRNPQTGQPITISAKRVVTFRPSKVLKRAMNR